MSPAESAQYRVQIPVRMHISRRYRPHSILPHHRSASSSTPPPPPSSADLIFPQPPPRRRVKERAPVQLLGLSGGAPTPFAVTIAQKPGEGDGDADGLGAFSIALMVRKNHHFCHSCGGMGKSQNGDPPGVLLAGMGHVWALVEAHQKPANVADRRELPAMEEADLDPIVFSTSQTRGRM